MIFPIIGTGGIVDGVDAFEHVLCGASAVQIGTVLVDEGLVAFDRRLQKPLARSQKRNIVSKL